MLHIEIKEKVLISDKWGIIRSFLKKVMCYVFKMNNSRCLVFMEHHKNLVGLKFFFHKPNSAIFSVVPKDHRGWEKAYG